MKIADMKDAKKDHEFNMVLIDCANITRRSLNNCVNIHSLMRCDKSIKQAKVCKTMTYILFDEDKVPTRFQNTSLVKEVVRINDQEGKAGLVKLLSKNGGKLALKLAKPRPQIRLKNLRSDAMRAARKKSFQKNKDNPKTRSYKRAAEVGIRSGSGKAHVWETDEA